VIGDNLQGDWLFDSLGHYSTPMCSMTSTLLRLERGWQLPYHTGTFDTGGFSSNVLVGHAANDWLNEALYAILWLTSKKG